MHAGAPAFYVSAHVYVYVNVCPIFNRARLRVCTGIFIATSLQDRIEFIVQKADMIRLSLFLMQKYGVRMII